MKLDFSRTLLESDGTAFRYPKKNAELQIERDAAGKPMRTYYAEKDMEDLTLGRAARLSLGAKNSERNTVEKNMDDYELSRRIFAGGEEGVEINDDEAKRIKDGAKIAFEQFPDLIGAIGHALKGPLGVT